ncbi:[protein ADP-ribosylglutamate] hydrolase [Thermococcus barophilus]|uniref:Mitogen-activated protein kinase kinase kinase n=1 Tax=Thermococcus barophilus TaxID=55802 RepID=A0A0S1XCM1_THEBA|nr:Mitogen-activated protein kinase kinase kinase [Thermococcus barophilus]
MKKATFSTFIAALIVISLVTNLTSATEWRVYKNNPQHTGVATDALEPPLELFWKFKTGGPIVSSPAVYEGILYFGSSDYYFYAIDSLTGEVKWKFKTNGRIDASPAVWKNTVYVGSLDGNLYALDAKTGELKWKFEALGSIVSSPVVEYGLVVFGSTGGFIYALNATTGEKKWVFKTEGKVEASPAVYGQLLIAGSYDGKVYALGAKSGALIWIFDAGGPITSGSVVVDSGTVYVIAGAKYLYALDVMSGKVKWKRELGRREHYRYAFGWYLSSKEDIPIEEGYSPSVSAGVIYGAYRLEKWYSDGTKKKWLYLSSFDTQNGQTKWQFEVGGPIQNAPTISGGTVYFGCDDGYLYAVHADSGKLKWKYLINSSIRSSPVIANGILYVGADDGYLYAFASDEVIATYSKLTSLRKLISKLRNDGVHLSEEVDNTLSNAEYLLRIGELDKAKSEISRAEDIISKARYDYTKELLNRVKETYATLESKGFDVTTVKTLIVQAEKELNAGNYDKAIGLINQANGELQNIKSSEAERAQTLLNEVKLELKNVEDIANVSEFESSLADVQEKIKNGEYPSAIALLEEIRQKIEIIQEANSAILSAEAIISQKKEEGLDTTEAEKLLERARELFSAGDYENAKKLAEQATTIIGSVERVNQKTTTNNNVDGSELTNIITVQEQVFGMKNEYLYLMIVLALLIPLFVMKRKKSEASIKFGKLTFSIVQGDITKFPAEAIVNSVDKYLTYRGGVSRSVAKAAVGDVNKYRKISRDIMKNQIGRDWIRHGEVVVTPPFKLERNGVKYVINTFGPDCKARWNKKLKETLKLSIIAALRKADELGATRIAFPAIRAGPSGCPFKRVVETFLESVEEFSKEAKNIREIFLVLRTKEDYDTALEILREWKRKGGIKESTLEKHKPSEEDVVFQDKGFPSELLDNYAPLEFIGEGGFAKVFKAKRKSDDQIVALKIPRIDEKTSSLFLKEVAAWYHLNHPNIVELYKADILPIPYLEMEYVEGVKIDGKLIRDLDKYPKPVDEKTALKIIKGIAEGLKHAHSKGIWHLDLTPLNVLLKSDLTPKITDWGLAKISARTSSTIKGLTPQYAAPEQLDEKTYGNPDHRTDIYELGVIFYELLTGRLPYESYSLGALVGKILAKDVKPMPPSKINPSLAKYDGIIEKLLAKRKEDRFQSVGEFLRALESLEALHMEREKLKKSLEKTKLTLKRSRSRDEIQRLTREAVEKTAKIALLSAKLNDKAELLNALGDLKFYTRENLESLLNAISQIEYMMKEGIPISDEFIDHLKVLLHKIEREV